MENLTGAMREEKDNFIGTMKKEKKLKKLRSEIA